MQLNTNIDKQQKNSDIYILITMLTLLVIPTYFYGVRVLIIAAVALVTATLCEIIFNLLFSYKRVKNDLSFLTTAMGITLIMPASTAYYTVIIAVIFGLFLGKYVFGASGKNIFNPTAVGVAIVALSFPEEVLKYPQPGVTLPLKFIISDTTVMGTSPATTLNVGGTPTIHFFDMLLGDFVGSIGATCVIVLICIMIFLMVTRAISFLTIVSYLAVVVGYAALFPRLSTGVVDSVVYELISGIMILGLIYIICDYNTSPKTALGRIYYGMFVALLTMIYRSLGALDIEIVFVALVANALSAQFDIWALKTLGRYEEDDKIKPQKIAVLDDATLEEIL